MPLTTPALALWLHAAALAEVPKVAVVGLHGDALDLAAEEALSDAVGDAIDKTGKAKARTGRSLQSVIASRRDVVLRDAFSAAGRKKLEEGRLLYNRAQAEDSVPVLTEAVADLQEAMAVCDASADLWEAWLLLGLAQETLEDEAAALTAWAAAATLAPGRTPDPARVAPDSLARFEEVRTTQARRPANLEVQGQASSVLLDGQPRGAAPLTLTDVLPGRHDLLAVGDDGQSQHLVVEVAAGESRTLALALAQPHLPAAAASTFGRSQQSDALYRALGRQTQSEYVLVMGVDDANLSMQLYAPAREVFSKVTSVPVSGSPDDEAALAVGLLLNLLDAQGALPSEATASAAALRIDHNPWLDRALLDPAAAQAVPVDPTPRKGPKAGLIAGVSAGGAAVVTGIVTGLVLGLRGPPETVHDGTITVGPFE